MIRSMLLAAALTVPAIAQAQTAAPASAAKDGACIVREQAEQLITTLKQRNDQLRDMVERMKEMEARVAASDAAVAQAESSRKALLIATQKNHELAEIGEAIISDYEKRKLGSRIGTKEPLTQLYRVRLENKMEEYRDQIAAQGFYPERELDMLQAPLAGQAATAPAPEPVPAPPAH